jgi:hypothetical protein
MNAVLALDTGASLAEELRHKVQAASKALEKRYGKDLAEAQRDLLLATYVLGLTTPFYEDAPPADHLSTIRTCLERVMPAERAARALDTAPDEHEGWLCGVHRSVEVVGHKDGHALFMRCGSLARVIEFQNRHEQAVKALRAPVIRLGGG